MKTKIFWMQQKKEARFDRLMKFQMTGDSTSSKTTSSHSAPSIWPMRRHGRRCGSSLSTANALDTNVYRVAHGEKPPQREELDDLDEASWPKRDGKPNDPWVFQYSAAAGKSGDRRGRDLCTRSSRRADWLSVIWRMPTAKQRIAKRKPASTAASPSSGWRGKKCRPSTAQGAAPAF